MDQPMCVEHTAQNAIFNRNVLPKGLCQILVLWVVQIEKQMKFPSPLFPVGLPLAVVSPILFSSHIFQ